MASASFRRNNRPAGEVAIYQNMNTVHYCTNNMDGHAKYTSMFNATVSNIGNMCISRYHSGDNQFIIMVAVYISPNKSLRAIRDFLQKKQQLIEFLNNEFDLTMSNDRNLSATKYKTIIDARLAMMMVKESSKLWMKVDFSE
ncbi:hypothetical protein PV326_012060, partial [Microctonus aethiopoides]